MSDQMVHDLIKPPVIFCLLFSYEHIELGKNPRVHFQDPDSFHV